MSQRFTNFVRPYIHTTFVNRCDVCTYLYVYVHEVCIKMLHFNLHLTDRPHGAIQVLCIIQCGGGGRGGIAENSVTKGHGLTLLALRGGGCISALQKKHYVTLEWPL